MYNMNDALYIAKVLNVRLDRFTHNEFLKKKLSEN